MGIGIIHQRNHSTVRLATIVLVALRNDVEELRRPSPELLVVVATIQPGQVVQIGPPQDSDG